MKKFQTDIGTVAAANIGPSSDPTVTALVHLAKAHAVLASMTIEPTIGDSLITTSIEHIFRQVMALRKEMPPEMLDTTRLSKYGRLVDESKR